MSICLFVNNYKNFFCPYKIWFEPTFFQVLWRFVFSLPLQGEAGGKGVGRKGGLVFTLPPAEPIDEIGSDFF